MIYFNNISKVYKTDFWKAPNKILDSISFEVPEGKITGFLGANGAGKTTLIKIALGLTPATGGEVEFSSKLGNNFLEVKKNIGLLPERPYFYPHLEGMSFLKYLGKLSSVPNTLLKQRIDFWAKRVNIHYALNRKMKSYSKGMLQRLGFLTTMIHDPKFIILDEPLGGLDPVGRKELKEIILEMAKEGKTVFFTSHIVPDVEEISENIVFLKNGKIVYQGPLESLIDKQGTASLWIRLKGSRNLDLNGPHEVVQTGKEKREILTIRVKSEDLNAILKEIVEKKLRIISLEREMKTLEDLFFNWKVN